MKLPITASLIANKSDGVVRCIKSIQNTVSQIAILDTGDGEVSRIADEFGATTRTFKWCDDFSAARNACLELATEPWILVIDSDEILQPNSENKISNCLRTTADAFSVVTKNYTKSTTCSTWFPLDDLDNEARHLGFTGWFPSYKIRLFRNFMNLKFRNRVHELIKAPASQADFYILHLNEEEKESPSWLHKKNYYLKLGQMKLAENPRDAQANFELGLQFSELGHIESAISCFETVVKLDPSFGDQYYGNANFELGNLYGIKIGDAARAIHHYEQSIKLRPNHSPSYYNMGQLFSKMGEINKTIELSRKAIELNPSFAVAYNSLANGLTDLGHYPEAAAMASQALALNPGLSTAYQTASHCLYKLGRKKEAFQMAEQGMEKAPHDFGAYYNIGRIAYQEKDFNTALRHFNIAVKLEPTRHEAYNHLAAIYLELGLLRLADHTFQQALLKCPINEETISNYAIFQNLRTKQKEN